VISQVENTQHLHEELQLGNKLSQCVHTGERSEFDLLLAMLDQDVQQHSQFTLPKTESKEQQTDCDSLRKLFNLPAKQPLGLDSVEQIEQFNQADLVEKGCIDSIRLRACLNPSAVAFRDDKSHIETALVNNLSLHCRHRLNQNQLEKQPSKRLAFDAAGWLSGIRDTVVASSLV